MGSRELKQVHPASFCFPTTQPVPPVFAAPSGGWPHAYAVMAIPRLGVALPPAAVQLSRDGCPMLLLHAQKRLPPQQNGLQLCFTGVQSESLGLKIKIKKKKQQKSWWFAASHMKEWEARSPFRSVFQEWISATKQHIRSADPREAAEKVLSSRIRCLSVPAVTDEVSAKANKLHLRWWLVGLNAPRSYLKRNSSELLC